MSRSYRYATILSANKLLKATFDGDGSYSEPEAESLPALNDEVFGNC